MRRRPAASGALAQIRSPSINLHESQPIEAATVSIYMLDDFSNLFRYEIWANRRVLESLRQVDPPSKAIELFAHILAGQEVWLARLRGQDSSALLIWPSRSVEDCERALARLEREVEAYIASLTEDVLEKKISYSNQLGHHWQHTARQILTHLAFHSHYHRGQIASRLRDAGLTPNNTDFIHYLRVGADGSAKR